MRAGDTNNTKGKERDKKEEKKTRQKDKGKNTCPRGKMDDHTMEERKA